MPNLPDLPNGDHQVENPLPPAGGKNNDYRIYTSNPNHYNTRVVTLYDKDQDTPKERTTDLNVTWNGDTQVSGDRIVTVWKQVSDRDKGDDKIRVKAKLFYEYRDGKWHLTRGETPTGWYWDGEIFSADIIRYTTYGKDVPITGSQTSETFSHP